MYENITLCYRYKWNKSGFWAPLSGSNYHVSRGADMRQLLLDKCLYNCCIYIRWCHFNLVIIIVKLDTSLTLCQTFVVFNSFTSCNNPVM